MNPLVSILIPAYNAEAHLEQTVKSALDQSWPGTEIIIVDDGSTDGTLDVAKRYESKVVKVITQPNGGQCAAFNRAMSEAQGELFEYLDADDLLSPDKIERQVKLFAEYGRDFVFSCEWARFYSDPAEAVFVPQLPWRDAEPIDWLVDVWGNNLMMHGAAWLVPRAVAESAGPWDERLSLINDFDYFSRVLLASSGVKFCNGARTYYRSGNSSSLSQSNSTKAFTSAFLSLDVATKNLLSVEVSDRTRRACATVFQRFIYEAYPSVAALRDKAAAKVQELGGASVEPDGGPIFKLLSRLCGWKLTKRAQRAAYTLGYKRAAIGNFLRGRTPRGADVTHRQA